MSTCLRDCAASAPSPRIGWQRAGEMGEGEGRRERKESSCYAPTGSCGERGARGARRASPRRGASPRRETP
eukprot:scaffold12434_cov37-Tisochrysis_lutea.AAC.4